MKKILVGVIMLFIWASTAFGSSFTLVPPQTNNDGSMIIGDLGYKFYCGTQSQRYDIIKTAGHLDVNSNGVCTYPIGEVIPTDGTWFCVATAYYMFDQQLESTYSNEIFFVVNGGVVPSVVPNPPSFGFHR